MMTLWRLFVYFCAVEDFNFISELKQMLTFRGNDESICLSPALEAAQKENFALNKQLSALLFRISVLLIALSLAPAIAHAVDAPRDGRGTVVRPTVIKWEWSRVSDATRYQVDVNGSFVGMTSDLFFYSRDLPNGNYSFTVQAVDGNGRYSSRSEKSAVRTIGDSNNSANNNSGNSNTSTASSSASSDNKAAATSNLPAPAEARGTVVRLGQIKWEWFSVSGAEQYEVFVNNNSAGLTKDLFLYSRNLSEGEHTMTVRAVDSSGNRSADSNIAKRSIDAGQGSSSNTSANNSTSSSTSSSSSSNNNASLDTPRDPRGTRVRAAEIKWEWAQVSGASEYEVVVDGVAQRTGSTFLYTSNLSTGEHTMTVKAVGSDGRFSNASNQAVASTWENGSGGDSNNNNAQTPAAPAENDQSASLDRPRDVRGTQVRDQEIKWEWSRVPDAARYEVFLDGASADITGDDYLYTPNLAGGEHTITVAAIDSEGRYSERSDAASVTIGGSSEPLADNSDTAPPPPAPENDNGLIDPATYNYSEATQKDGYELVFSDEFNAGSLNRARWNTQLRWDGSWNGDRYEYRLVNGEAQFYVNIFSEDRDHLNKVASVYNPFKFNGNRLAIQTTRNPLKSRDGDNGYGPLDLISTQQPFLSGAISTYDKFTQKYGYFEARIKIPSHVGTFPAFWLHHQKREWEGTQKTEIDIMENLGHAPWYVYNSFHYFTGVSEGVGGTPHFVKPQPQGQIHTGTIYSDDYHVYAAEWKPGHIRFLIDGQQVSEVRNSASDHEELYLIINMAVGGIWTNMPSNAGGTGRQDGNKFPTQQDINEWKDPALEIDYVRVYKSR